MIEVWFINEIKMKNEFWVNLPVKNLQRSVAFYTSIGFSLRDQPDSTEAHLFIDDTAGIVNLFEEPVFKMMAVNSFADSYSTPSRSLFTIDAESFEQVKEMRDKVTQAGGNILREQRDGKHALFGIEFTCPDGHLWSILFREDKMPLIKSYFDGKDTHGHIKQPK